MYVEYKLLKGQTWASFVAFCIEIEILDDYMPLPAKLYQKAVTLIKRLAVVC